MHLRDAQHGVLALVAPFIVDSFFQEGGKRGFDFVARLERGWVGAR